VRHHGLDARLLDALSEQCDLRGVEWLAAPLIRVFREDLQRLASVNDGPVNGFRHPARYGHVCADSHDSL
jgi:hypothetical protein